MYDVALVEVLGRVVQVAGPPAVKWSPVAVEVRFATAVATVAGAVAEAAAMVAGAVVGEAAEAVAKVAFAAGAVAVTVAAGFEVAAFGEAFPVRRKCALEWVVPVGVAFDFASDYPTTLPVLAVHAEEVVAVADNAAGAGSIKLAAAAVVALAARWDP